MAEIPRGVDTSCKMSAYLRKLIIKFQKHTYCVPNRCLRGFGEKKLSKCKYEFPFHVPEYCEGLDFDMARYWEDCLVVRYNLEIAVLWGASHNIQRVSTHGFESPNPEPSLKIELPENASEPQKYLRSGAVEAIAVLLGFHISPECVFIPTELNPTQQRMLKPKFQL